MHNEIKLKDDFYWVGGNDRRIELFENCFPVPYGMSYNSYLILDNKTILIDGVDTAVRDSFINNIQHVLNGRTLDYVIINHMEPDHCTGFIDLLLRYPSLKFIGNVKTLKMLTQFYRNINEDCLISVKEGDKFSTGSHNFTFYLAPMVHWPEVMVTYNSFTKTIFSADAFGSFGALDGNIYHDMIAEKENYMNEARRYYSNIVGKYGPQVLNLLKKLKNLDIEMICSLHGPIWRKNLNEIIEKYSKWASYTPEENTVCIVYGSVYGNTQLVAERLASLLANKGINNIKLFDVAKTHYSYIISEIFKVSNLVFASITYSNGLFLAMENLLNDYISHNIENRKVSFIQNGSWAPKSCGIMKNMLKDVKNTSFIDPDICISSSCDEVSIEQLEVLCDNIISTLYN